MSDDEERVRTPLEASRRRLLGAGALGGLTVSAAGLLAACSSSAAGGTGSEAVGDYPSTPKWKWVFVSHLTGSALFRATKFGIQDATTITNCTYQWTGSAVSDVSQMVDAMDAAISSGADGIAVSLVHGKAFNGPTKKALDKGIPVVSFNADAPENDRLAYIGQDLFRSGQEMGKRIVSLIPSGKVAIFIALPGSYTMQRRMDGAMQAIKDSGAPIETTAIGTGTQLSAEQAKIDAYYQDNEDVKGMFAVDPGSTQSLGLVMKKYSLQGRVHGGGYDLMPTTLQLIKAGVLDFTIDQLPYYQGWIPAMYLYMYKLSGTLLTPSDTDTGLKFVTKDTVDPYLDMPNRYEGTSPTQQYVDS
jgi:simple sugar transport system substrate-binding protein